MAERRMFAKTIIDSDAFLDMPLSSQALYFHLSMRADDEGFINNPKKIQRMVSSSDDDMKLLIAKSFIIPFESGIVVIKHWKIHNYIQKDRFKPTVYQEERKQLGLKNNNAYTLDTPCIQEVSSSETQVRLGKNSIDKDNKNKEGQMSDKCHRCYSDEDFQRVAQVYQNNIHPIAGSIEKEMLEDMLTRHSADKVIEAISEAVKNGVRTIKYIDAILKNWETKGYNSKSKKAEHVKPEIQLAN